MSVAVHTSPEHASKHELLQRQTDRISRSTLWYSSGRQKAWRIIRSLVVGYIEEREESGGVIAEGEEDSKSEGIAAITSAFADERVGKADSSAGVPGKPGMLFNTRQTLGADNLASACRLTQIDEYRR